MGMAPSTSHEKSKPRQFAAAKNLFAALRIIGVKEVSLPRRTVIVL